MVRKTITITEVPEEEELSNLQDFDTILFLTKGAPFNTLMFSKKGNKFLTTLRIMTPSGGITNSLNFDPISIKTLREMIKTALRNKAEDKINMDIVIGMEYVPFKGQKITPRKPTARKPATRKPAARKPTRK